MTQQELAKLLAEMSRLAGQVKTEAETTIGVNASGVKYGSVRRSTLEELIPSMHRWEAQLRGLFSDDEVQLG